jgi:hypothetical protein
MNELEFDDAWSRSMFDKFLQRPLRQEAYLGGIVFVDFANPVAKLLQRSAGVDILAQTQSGGTISADYKIVRAPAGPRHWKCLFLEMYDCTTRGNEHKGWFCTSSADVLLWCQCAKNEDSLNCWPFPFNRLRQWTRLHYHELPERSVPNIIDSRALWTLGRLAPIEAICRDLKVEGFRVDETGLIRDLWGKPILGFLQ